MRVLHFLKPHIDHGGAPLPHVFNLAKAQSAHGHDVGLVYLDEGAGVNITETLARAKGFCTLGIERLAIDPHNPLSVTGTTLAAYFEAGRLTQKQGVDVLHGHGASGGNTARHIQRYMRHKKAGTVCVYSPHGDTVRPQKVSWPLSRPEKNMWPLTSGIIFESDYSHEKYIMQHGPAPCPTQTIHDGLAEEEFAPRQIIDMATDFVFVGEMIEQQGIDILVKALARMKKSHTTDALLIGSGPSERELRAQVDRYGLTHKIFFNAPLDARTAFLKAGCLVLPAKDSSIPAIALQAGAAGVPMILTDVGGIREMIGNVKMPLIAPNDTRALQEQLVAYLTNPQLFLGRAAKLKTHINKTFSLARMYEETDQFYTQITKQ